MKAHLIAVGNRMPDWVEHGFRDYQQRLPRTWACELKTIPVAKQRQSIRVACQQEGKAMLAAIPNHSFTIALTVDGRIMDSPGWTDTIQKLEMRYSSLSFLIGGPDGLAPACLERAQACWSLSALTFPHALARIIFIEQFYRAACISQNHPYHR